MTGSTRLDPARPLTRRQSRLLTTGGGAVVPDREIDPLGEPMPGGRRDRRRRQSGSGTDARGQESSLLPPPSPSPALTGVAADDPTTTHSLAVLASPEFFHEGEAQDEPVPPPTLRPDPVTSAGSISPVEARSAFGLQPLDAMTAGLGRSRRLRYLRYSALGVGVAVLGAGIMMIISALNG